ncbi:hypothetical protein [Nostoc sp.]|uniref:hypothetical protein n=1 Tax=Nostoc sp. TaxID=1180 RepID=UPI002FF4B77F
MNKSPLPADDLPPTGATILNELFYRQQKKLLAGDFIKPAAQLCEFCYQIVTGISR